MSRRTRLHRIEQRAPAALTWEDWLPALRFLAQFGLDPGNVVLHDFIQEIVRRPNRGSRGRRPRPEGVGEGVPPAIQSQRRGGVGPSGFPNSHEEVLARLAQYPELGRENFDDDTDATAAPPPQ